MLEVVSLKIKSHLSQQGLKKVIEIDKKRVNNENLGIEFSQETWRPLAEVWTGAEGFAMTKIFELYGLEISDLDLSKIQRNNTNKNTSNVIHQTNFDVD